VGVANILIMKYFTLILFFCSQIIFAQYEWNYLGEAGFSPSVASFVDMKIDLADRPVVVFSDANNDNKVACYVYENENWEMIGGGMSTLGAASYNSVDINTGNRPVISFIEGNDATLGFIYYEGYNGQQNAHIWGANHPENAGVRINNCSVNTIVDFDSGQSRYYIAGHDVNTAVVKMATSLNDDFNNGETGGVASSIGFDAFAGTRWLGVAEVQENNRLFVIKRTSSSDVGWHLLSDGSVSNITVEVGIDTQPVVSFLDNLNGNKPNVIKFNGNEWVTLSPALFSDGAANYLDIALGIDGVPYVVFQDSSVGGKLSVMRHTGTEWEYVGPQGFTDSVGSYCRIDLNNSNLPVVAFSDASQGGKISVMTLVEVLGSDDEQIKQFAIAPVPTDNILSIQGIEGAVSVKVFDISGRLVMQETTNGELNVSGLNSGVYSIVISNDLYTETNKFIKQ
jgi:hypothetical protein